MGMLFKDLEWNVIPCNSKTWNGNAIQGLGMGMLFKDLEWECYSRTWNGNAIQGLGMGMLFQDFEYENYWKIENFNIITCPTFRLPIKVAYNIKVYRFLLFS